MPQDAFTLRLNALELDKQLRGGKINRINQPEREEVTLTIYTGGATKKLVLNANASDCGAYFTEIAKENPALAPGFCMLLRKHLLNAEIKEVSLVGFERILAFKLFCTSDFSTAERVLYAEIMGKYSNLILTENGVILGALKTTSVGDGCKRLIFPGAKYALPEPQDKIDPTHFSALQNLFDPPPEGELSHFLFTHVRGIAPVTAEQIVDAYRGGEFAKHVYDFLFSDEISACVTERDFFARQKEGARQFPTLSEAQEYFYEQRQINKQFEALRRKLESVLNAAVKKQEKRLVQIAEKSEECKDAERNRIYGELLTANLWRIPNGARGIELENFYEDGRTEKILLDPMRAPSENAQDYFKKYRKQKRTLETLAPMRESAEREITYLHSLRASLGFAKDTEDLVSLSEEFAEEALVAPQSTGKKKQPTKPFRTYEKDGFVVLAGRNNLENDKLIRSSRLDDIWLHAQKYHSCHVVIKTEGRKVPDEVLLFAASVCARYSDGKGDRVPVDYCEIKFVKKPPKSKPGFVIYTNYKTVLAEPANE